MQCNGLYKIGISNNPEKRLKQFKTGNPKIEMLQYSQKVFFAEWLEYNLHKLFIKQNVNGEWFSLKLDQVNTLVKLLKNLSDNDYYTLEKEFLKVC